MRITKKGCHDSHSISMKKITVRKQESLGVNDSNMFKLKATPFHVMSMMVTSQSFTSID